MLPIVKFILHFVEMCIAMMIGMAVYMAIPGVMALPPFVHQLGMAAAMTVPMVGWMRIRGHGWRHGVEMSIGMLVPWAAVLGLVSMGADRVFPWLAQADGAAMLLGMLAVMLLRPGHSTHKPMCRPSRPAETSRLESGIAPLGTRTTHA